MMSQIVFWALTVLALAGAATVVLTREVLRLALGLGAFLLAVAGYFALFGFGFLALAEVFVYVGGVLVIVLFAIMLVHRGEGGTRALTTRHDPVAAVASLGVGALVVTMLRPAVGTWPVGASSGASGTTEALSSVLLGRMLPQFEMAGVLLLVALVAVVVVMGGDE